jgi:hypothetical protein
VYSLNKILRRGYKLLEVKAGVGFRGHLFEEGIHLELFVEGARAQDEGKEFIAFQILKNDKKNIFTQ